jgi:superfamily I DNA/RNA helicase
MEESITLGVRPTEEQIAVIEVAPRPGDTVIVEACAGSGKTTLLEMYAKAYPGKNFLYLVFNKTAAEEAVGKFPPNVECRTTHSLAYRECGLKYRENSNKRLGGEIRAKAASFLLGVDPRTAQAVCDTITRFVQGAETEIEENHVPTYVQRPDQKSRVVQLAKKLWNRSTNVNDSQAQIGHDTYLKDWQIQISADEKLPEIFYQYDAILVDECQDLNPTFLAILWSIIEAGGHAVLLVGDPRQAIYGWRGAVNAMGVIAGKLAESGKTAISRPLTHSFRFGPRTAQIANRILRYGAPEGTCQHHIIGLGVDDPSAEGTTCYLARTNAELLRAAAERIRENPGLKIHFAATSDDQEWSPEIPYRLEFLRSVYHLSIGHRHLVADPEIKRFGYWNEIVTAAGRDRNGEGVDLELASAVGLIKKLGNQLLPVLERVSEAASAPWDADLIFSTAHRAKGLEWDQVILLDDFHALESTTSLEEANLIYVAATRAKRHLTLSRALTGLLQ